MRIKNRPKTSLRAISEAIYHGLGRLPRPLRLTSFAQDPRNDEVEGFTLAEILVVMAITAITGTILVAIFTNTLRGSNKSQILASIKQNGQAILENMDKTIRSADNVICPSTSGDTIAIVKNGLYARFKFIPPAGSANGMIQQDAPIKPSSGTESDINIFLANLCTNPMGTDSVRVDTLTDTNDQSGVSVSGGLFTRNSQSGFKDTITVSFTLGPAVGIPVGTASQIDPVTFQTTVQLR